MKDQRQVPVSVQALVQAPVVRERRLVREWALGSAPVGVRALIPEPWRAPSMRDSWPTPAGLSGGHRLHAPRPGLHLLAWRRAQGWSQGMVWVAAKEWVAAPMSLQPRD